MGTALPGKPNRREPGRGTAKEYRKEKAEDILDNWFDGSAKELFTALSEKIPKSEKERLKGVLDDMDFI